jgi:hypothetical protein
MHLGKGLEQPRAGRGTFAFSANPTNAMPFGFRAIEASCDAPTKLHFGQSTQAHHEFEKRSS